MNAPAEIRIESSTGKARRKGAARWAVRATLLAAATLLLSPILDHGHLAVVVPASSPLVAIASLLGTRTLPLATWIGLSVAAIVVLRRRWFCRWVCPTGTCAECATMLGIRLGRRTPRLPPVGQWIALLTVGGAALGYPLLLWLDPLALFSGLFSLFRAEPNAGLVCSALGLAAVLALTVVWPAAWCARLCPLGASQELLHGMARAVPSFVTRSRAAVHRKPVTGLPRRAVLGAAVGVLWAAAVRRVRAAAAHPLRPPGAVDEARFAGLCIRCGNCLRACPVHIIQPDPGEHGIAGLLAPRLDFGHDYCREDCVLCTAVCPSGALTPLAPKEKEHARIGLPRVNMEVCLLGDDRECSVCRNWCPYEAIQLVFSEIEYTLTPQIDPDKCPGCGACETACPTTPTKAITIGPR